MAKIIIDLNHATITGTDSIVGALSPVWRALVPEGKKWTYDPDTHSFRITLLDTAGNAMAAGTRIYLHKAGNDITSARVLLKEFSEGLLPTLANQANADYSGVMKLPSTVFNSGQEFQINVTVPVGGVACDYLLSTFEIEVEESDSRAP